MLQSHLRSAVRPAPRPSARRRTAIRSILTAVAILCAAAPVSAHLVYGYVRSSESGVEAGVTCEFTRRGGGDPVSVTTDEKGYYSVYLPPGSYRVSCGGKVGEVRSHEQPIEQDVVLR